MTRIAKLLHRWALMLAVPVILACGAEGITTPFEEEPRDFGDPILEEGLVESEVWARLDGLTTRGAGGGEVRALGEYLQD